jgi:hypothetical protein
MPKGKEQKDCGICKGHDLCGATLDLDNLAWSLDRTHDPKIIEAMIQSFRTQIAENCQQYMDGKPFD